METLISKLTALNTNYFEKLSSEDQQVCNSAKAKYEIVHNQLSFYLEKFLTAMELEQPKGTKVDAYSFLYLPVIEEIKVKMCSSKVRYFSELKVYFIEKYKLSKEFFDEIAINNKKSDPLEIYDLKIFLKFMFSKSPKLLELGFMNIKETLKNRVYYSTRVKNKGNKLILEDYVNYNSNFPGEVYGYGEHSKMEPLLLAICYFENKSFDFAGEYYKRFPVDNYKGDNKVDFEKNYLGFGNKIKSLRFFKNRRIDINFNCERDCQMFLEMYELLSLPISRW